MHHANLEKLKSLRLFGNQKLIGHTSVWKAFADPNSVSHRRGSVRSRARS
jgi:hypothetical protein